MSARCVLALDQGTSSSRAIVFDSKGEVLGLGQEDLPSSYPAPGHVEQDPEAIWQGTLRSAREAIKQAKINASDLLGIGITNQRETSLFWHAETGEALGPAIVWQDRRTARLCEQMRADGLEQVVADSTGLVLDPLLLGHQDRLATFARAGASGTRREGVPALRDSGLLPCGAPDRRACDRCKQCVAHAALRHRSPSMAPGSA